MGGFRLAELSVRSRLGEESRDEGLEESERGEMGLGWRPHGLSSGKTKSVILRKENRKNFKGLPCFGSRCETAPVKPPGTCRDDERQGRDGGRLGHLAPAGEPLFVRSLQLVAEASGAGRFFGRRVFPTGAVAAYSDPPEVGHNHLGCRTHEVEKQ